MTCPVYSFRCPSCKSCTYTTAARPSIRCSACGQEFATVEVQRLRTRPLTLLPTTKARALLAEARARELEAMADMIRVNPSVGEGSDGRG